MATGDACAGCWWCCGGQVQRTMHLRSSMTLHVLQSQALHSPLFFSSRRRHTRCYRDWSSDVYSSDLDEAALAERKNALAAWRWIAQHHDVRVRGAIRVKHRCQFWNRWIERVAEPDDIPWLCRPRCGVLPECGQHLIEGRRHHRIGIRTVEVIAAGWNRGAAAQGIVQDVNEDVDARLVHLGAQFIAERVAKQQLKPLGEDH